jgi:hypothetical protein
LLPSAARHHSRRAPKREAMAAKRMFLLVVGAFGLTAGGVAFGIDIHVCGREVPRRAVADLRGDLHCGPTGPGVFLDAGATLNLNGFTIAGPGGSGNGGVVCSSGRTGCTINGPGYVRGFGPGLSGTGRVRVRDVTLRFNGVGISTKGALLDLANVVANDNDTGVLVAGAGRLRADDLEVRNNRTAGVWVAGPSMVKLSRLTAVGNGGLGGGVYLGTRGRGQARIVDTILGNDGLGEGYDVLTILRGLKLIDTVCGRGALIRVSRRTLPEVTRIIRPLGCHD